MSVGYPPAESLEEKLVVRSKVKIAVIVVRLRRVVPGLRPHGDRRNLGDDIKNEFGVSAIPFNLSLGKCIFRE